MRKITYIILSLCLCTAGIGTAAHLSPAALLTDSLSAVINDTIPDEEEDVFDDEEDEEDEDEYGEEEEEEDVFDDEEDEEDEDEYGEEEEEEDEFDDEEDDEYDDEEFDDEEDEDEDEDELDDEEEDEDEDEYDDEEDEEEEEDSFFTDEEEAEFGEMHDDFDEAATIEEDTIDGIELTEGMRVSAKEQMESYSAQNYLTADTTQYTFKEADAELYIDRLRRMPLVMEMPYNDVVRKYIDQYARMQRSVSIMLGAQNFYNPIFEEALEAEGVPLELKYLPVIESAYNPAATSPVGAAGLWQFMPATGKQYGLEINSLVDERRDPIKSSYAAARLLKYLHKYYGDWSLVIAAYNCGPGNVNKAIQRAGGVKDYWAIYNYLPKETRGYVPAFIAANYIMTYYCEHGITPMQAKLPAETDTVMVSRDLHFKQVADLCNVSVEQLKDLNPQYRTQVVPGYWRPCILRLPTEAISKFIACGDSIYTYQASELLPRRSVAAIGHANPSSGRTNTYAAHTTTTPRSGGYARSNYSGYTKPRTGGYTKPRTTYTRKTNYGRTGGYARGNGYTQSQAKAKAQKSTRTTATKGKKTSSAQARSQQASARKKTSSSRTRSASASKSKKHTSSAARSSSAKRSSSSAKRSSSSAKRPSSSKKSSAKQSSSSSKKSSSKKKSSKRR